MNSGCNLRFSTVGLWRSRLGGWKRSRAAGRLWEGWSTGCKQQDFQVESASVESGNWQAAGESDQAMVRGREKPRKRESWRRDEDGLNPLREEGGEFFSGRGEVVSKGDGEMPDGDSMRHSTGNSMRHWVEVVARRGRGSQDDEAGRASRGLNLAGHWKLKMTRRRCGIGAQQGKFHEAGECDHFRGRWDSAVNRIPWGARTGSIFTAGSIPRSMESRGRLNSAERSNSAEIDFGEEVEGEKCGERVGNRGRTEYAV